MYQLYIGSGPRCDGQVVVVIDILGLISFAQLPRYMRVFLGDEHYYMAGGWFGRLRGMVEGG